VVVSSDLDVVRQNLLDGDYSGAQERLAALLVEDPRVAQAWVYAAELSERTGRPYQAWQAYRRAWLLDPQAAWAPGIHGRLSSLPEEDFEEWFEHLLVVEAPSVAAAVIVKDEAHTIRQCVESLQGAVDELIVVDTGSTDGTLDILRELEVPVLKFGWTGSFADARNFALSHVKSDWVLWVDGDEALNPEDVDTPRIAAGLFDTLERPIALRIVQVNDIGGRFEANMDMSRLHPTRFGIRWYGRIHEQLGLNADDPKTQELIPRVAVNIRLNHVGYHPTVMQAKDKLQRNIALLKKAVEDDPEDLAALGFLGRELLFVGDVDGSIAALYKAETLARDQSWYGRISEIRNFLIEGLLRQDRIDEARAVANRGVADSPDYPGLWYAKGRVELVMLTKLLGSAKEAFDRAQTTSLTYRGIVAYDSLIPVWRAKAGVADLTRFSGDLVTAKRLYEELLGIDPNLTQMRAQIDRIDEQARVLAAGLDSANPVGNSIDDPPSVK
jgi:glycosyltransferase involved in cell wall biosynthesis